MTNLEDLGWAGGFFDGEGCIHVRDNRHGSISIQVSQRHRESLERLQSIVGVGNIYRVKSTPSRRGWYVYSVGSASDVLHFASTLIPFTTVKHNELELARRIAAFGRYSRDPNRRKVANRLIDYQASIRR